MTRCTFQLPFLMATRFARGRCREEVERIDRTRGIIVQVGTEKVAFETGSSANQGKGRCRKGRVDGYERQEGAHGGAGGGQGVDIRRLGDRVGSQGDRDEWDILDL